jgi:tRNA(Arg) A34 adenosine deaminase TadA
MNKDFMREAIRLALENVNNGGGPFGAVIVKDGKIIATGVNRVTANNDPTAHAEVCAIRSACQALDTFVLEGCDIYSTCEPCPMCLGAIYWAHIDRLYYACNKYDAADAGFDDSFIYKELALTNDERRLKTEILIPEEAKRIFEEWKNNEDKTEY